MSFDSISTYYRRLENIAFGNALQKARIFFLDQIPRPRRVLIAGEGDGRFLQEFAHTFPDVRVDCVDASARMLQLARTRLRNDDDVVRFLNDDLLTWQPEEHAYDLVATHFFLDCFDQCALEKIVATLAKSATGNAVWLIADFSIPTGTLRKIHARAWLWAMHRFFRFVAGISATTLIDPSPFLEAHGFRRVKRKQWRAGLVASELWERSR